MAHTHEYDCKQCGVHLDSQRELDEHNREHHSAQASSGSSSSSSGMNASSQNTGGTRDQSDSGR